MGQIREPEKYQIFIFDLVLDDDGTLSVSRVDRSNEVPSLSLGDAWIEGYIQGQNDTEELSFYFERVNEQYQRLFRVRIGKILKVFFLQEAFKFDNLTPHALFLEYEAPLAYPKHEVSREDILEAIENYRVNEAAAESIDERESLFDQST